LHKRPNIITKFGKKVATVFTVVLMAALLAIAASAEAGYVNTKQSRLNVRTGAGLTYSVITALPKGTKFEILGQSGDWTKIQYGNITGYVYSAYVGRYANTANTANTYRAINLPVPYYTQYDSRWASIKLGSYGEVIRNIGCTVTSAAMTESYRTGQVITPATIASTHSFTPGGALYWKPHYIRYTGSDWVTYVYNQLAAGRPAIYHGQTKSGIPHWVVIYGYTGGQTLNAANFLIRDPASTARTTFAQYFAIYPSYVKLVHYK
jgi:uncharacterized protein YraI